MVPNSSVAKKGPNFSHVAKKGAVFWSHIPEGNPVCLMVTGANLESGRRREWRLLFSHLSLSLHISHFLTLSCQVGQRGWPHLPRLLTPSLFCFYISLLLDKLPQILLNSCSATSQAGAPITVERTNVDFEIFSPLDPVSVSCCNGEF